MKNKNRQNKKEFIMKRMVNTGLVTLFLFISAGILYAGDMSFGTPEVETLMDNGPVDKKADIVFLGEGYQSHELSKYDSDVQAVMNFIFSVEPFKSSQSSFNVHKVNVISTQSGSDHPPSDVNTAFDTYYDGRLILIGNWTNKDIARDKAPDFDVVIMLVNDSTYGGAGYMGVIRYGVAVSYTGSNRNKVAAHELGHSYGLLADEYQYNNGSTYTGPEPSEPNVTIDNNPSTVKWSQHIGIEGVSIYEGARYHDYGIYRPTSNGCMMRSLISNFCRVCRYDGISEITKILAPPALVQIDVTPSPASIKLGQTQQFTATGTYEDSSTAPITPVWSSSNPSVATIDADGLATSLTEGTTIITAELDGITGNATLTVLPVLVSIEVTPITASIAKGQTQQFTATGTYSDDSTQDITSTCSWSSSNLIIATINTTGLATGVGQGTVTITASQEGVGGTATLTVMPPVLESIEITPSTATIGIGQTQQFTATAIYSDSSTEDITSDSLWSSSNDSVASIDTNALAAALTEGITTITAEFEGMTDTATLTVTLPVLISIEITPSPASVGVDQTQQFTATGTYSDSSTQDITSTCSWASSNPSIATIDSNGLATGVAKGSVTITASQDGVTGSTTLSVNLPLVSIEVTPTAPNNTTSVGGTRRFFAKGHYSDGSTKDISSACSWASSDTSIATVSSTGMVTGQGGGTAIISATQDGITGEGTIIVLIPSPKSITLTSPNGGETWFVGKTYDITWVADGGSNVILYCTYDWDAWYYRGEPTYMLIANHLSPTDGSYTWTIPDDPRLFSANRAKIAIGLDDGITAVWDYSNTCFAITVPTLTSIEVTPSSASIDTTQTQQFTATGIYNDGSTQDFTSTCSWSSSNPTVATIDANGLASGHVDGTVTISATKDDITGTAALTVTPLPGGSAVYMYICVASIDFSTSTKGKTESLHITVKAIDQDGVPVEAATVVGTLETPAGSTENYSGLTGIDGTVSFTHSVKNSALLMGAYTFTVANIIKEGRKYDANKNTETQDSYIIQPPTLVSIQVTPPSATIGVGQTQQFNATAHYSDGSTQDITSACSWSSSNPWVVSIDTAGLATSKATGTVTITATKDDVSGTATLTVTDESPANYISVSSIHLLAEMKGKTEYLYMTVKIVDQDGAPVEAATVSGTLTLPFWQPVDGMPTNTVSYSGNTEADGTVTFKYFNKNSPLPAGPSGTGLYTFTVTDVSKTGTTYDSTKNTETEDSYTKP